MKAKDIIEGIECWTYIQGALQKVIVVSKVRRKMEKKRNLLQCQTSGRAKNRHSISRAEKFCRVA